MARHEESSRSTCTRRWDEPSNQHRCRDGLDGSDRDVLPNRRWKDRHIQVRWLRIQDAIRDKVVRLKKVKDTENEGDIGTKDLDGPSHQRLLQKLPLKPTQCRRPAGLDVFSIGDECDICSIPDVCDVERIASGEVVQHSSSGEDC